MSVAIPSQMIMTPLPTPAPQPTPEEDTDSPTDSPTVEPTPQPMSVALPTQMVMPTRDPQPTPTRQENGVVPTQVTMPPVSDGNMSFDVNRLLDNLMHEEMEHGKNRNNIRRRNR